MRGLEWRHAVRGAAGGRLVLEQVQGASGSGTFAYTVAPTDGEIEIVSVGNANGVTRRINVVAESGGGQQIFSDATVKSQDTLTMDSNAKIHANAATTAT